MRRILLPALVAGVCLSLAACSDEKKVEAKNESVADVAKKVAASDIRFTPGRWETTVKIEKMEIEGMPPEAKAAMQQAMGQARTMSSCLTQAQVEKPNSEFFGQVGDGCKYDSFTMAGGKLDAKMTCKTARGEQVVTMGGTYTPESYDATMNMDGKGPDGKTMTMAMSMKSKRAGDCTGTEDVKPQPPAK